MPNTPDTGTRLIYGKNLCARTEYESLQADSLPPGGRVRFTNACQPGAGTRREAGIVVGDCSGVITMGRLAPRKSRIIRARAERSRPLLCITRSCLAPATSSRHRRASRTESKNRWLLEKSLQPIPCPGAFDRGYGRCDFRHVRAHLGLFLEAACKQVVEALREHRYISTAFLHRSIFGQRLARQHAARPSYMSREHFQHTKPPTPRVSSSG